MRPFSASTAQMQAVPPLHMRARVYVSQAQIDRNVANHRRNRMVKLMNIINIPAEALPACENDQNYYVLTARSQFLHSKPIKKKVRLLWE